MHSHKCFGGVCTYLEISQDTDVMCNNISDYHKVQFVWIVKRRLKMQSDGNERPSSKKPRSKSKTEANKIQTE